MFGELFNISIDPGPFDMDWSNIPIIKNHKLQKTKNGFFGQNQVTFLETKLINKMELRLNLFYVIPLKTHITVFTINRHRNAQTLNTFFNFQLLSSITLFGTF